MTSTPYPRGFVWTARAMDVSCDLRNPHDPGDQPQCGSAAGILSWSDGYAAPSDLKLCGHHVTQLGALGEPIDGLVRSEVRSFALAMEARLRERDAAKGDSWTSEPAGFFLKRITDELLELLEVAMPRKSRASMQTQLSIQHYLATQLRRYVWFTLDTEFYFTAPKQAQRVLEEAADVANFLMMFAWRVARAAAQDQRNRK